MQGEIIRRATGMDLTDYAHQKLFQPLGIDRFE
jgi:CubicO group peptidase (beta-lactamase class C family)